MIAPSERHLEDWLVNNPQKIFDFSDEHPSSLQWVARQLNLPSGRADLIGYEGGGDLAVFELKKGAIDSDTLAQCLRYMRDIDKIGEFALAQIRNLVETPELEYADPVVSGVIVGHGIKDRNLLTAAFHARISVFSYNYHPENDSYSFTQLFADGHRWETYYEYSLGILGQYIQVAYRDRVDYLLQCNGIEFDKMSKSLACMKISELANEAAEISDE